MTDIDFLKYGADVLIDDLENYRFAIIDLIEQNLIKGTSALKPMTLLVQTQIINLVNFLKQMKELIE